MNMDIDIYSEMENNKDPKQYMNTNDIIREKNLFIFDKENNKNSNDNNEDFILFSPIEKDIKKSKINDIDIKGNLKSKFNRNIKENNFNLSNIATPCSLGVSSINAFQELRLKINSRNDEFDFKEKDLKKLITKENNCKPFSSYEKVNCLDKRENKIDDILNQLGTDREEYYNIKSLLENDKAGNRNKICLNMPIGSVNTISELKHCVFNKRKVEKSYLKNEESTDYSVFSKKNNFEFSNKLQDCKKNNFGNFAKFDEKFKNLIYNEKIHQEKKETKLSSIIKSTKKYVSRPYNNQNQHIDRNFDDMNKFYSKFINCNLNDNEVENLYSDYFSIIKEKVQSNPKKVLDRNFDINFKKVQYENYNESNIFDMRCIKLKKEKKSALELMRTNLTRESKNSNLKINSYNTSNSRKNQKPYKDNNVTLSFNFLK